jgi:hypothetical protein
MFQSTWNIENVVEWEGGFFSRGKLETVIVSHHPFS